MTGKMAIIGDGDSVMCFTAGGIDSYSVIHPEKAKDLIKSIAKKYQIIFITDVIAKEIDEFIKRYDSVPYPIILSVPSKAGSNGYGMNLLKKSMEKALGVDILFNKEDEETLQDGN